MKRRMEEWDEKGEEERGIEERGVGGKGIEGVEVGEREREGEGGGRTAREGSVRMERYVASCII